MLLLERSKEIYSDKKIVPAIHPRYQATYQHLYETENQTSSAGTFGLRVFICFLLFIAFVVMDGKGGEMMHVDSEKIAYEITRNLDVKEVWRNL